MVVNRLLLTAVDWGFFNCHQFSEKKVRSRRKFVYHSKYLINYLFSDVTLVNLYVRYSGISERSTTKVYTLEREFEVGIHFIREL